MTIDYSAIKELDEDVKFLAHIMQKNRMVHVKSKVWEKIRRDRIAKLFYDTYDACTDAWVARVIEYGVEIGLLVECHKQCEEGLVPAIKLKKFVYNQDMRFYANPR